MTSRFVLDQTLDFSNTARLQQDLDANSVWIERLAKLRRAVRRQWGWMLAALGTGALGGLIHSNVDYDNWPLIASAWALGGLALALAIGAAREALREAIDFKMVRDRIDCAVTGAAPHIEEASLRQLSPDQRTPLGLMLQQPSSDFATAFRALQRTLADNKILSVAAPYAGGGATTTALCVAISAAQQQRKVILVDCDLRRRGVTRALGEDPADGVLEASAPNANWRAMICEEPETGLHVLPAARPANPWRSLRGAKGLAGLLEKLRYEYDIVVLDCPPVMGDAEGAALAQMADRSLAVAAWDETPLPALRKTLRALKGRNERPVSLYVNHVPTGDRLRRWRS